MIFLRTILIIHGSGLISGLSSGRCPGNAQLAGRPESAQVIPMAQPSSLRTPWSVHSRTSVHHEHIPHVPPGFGLYNSMPCSITVSINLVQRNF